MSGRDTNSGSGAELIQRINSLVDGMIIEKLSKIELGVLLVLIRHADGEGIAFPGPELIAKKLGCTIRAVYASINSLTSKRLITTLEGGTGGRGIVAKRKMTDWRNPAQPFSESTSTDVANSESQRAETLNAASLNTERPRTKTLNAQSDEGPIKGPIEESQIRIDRLDPCARNVCTEREHAYQDDNPEASVKCFLQGIGHSHRPLTDLQRQDVKAFLVLAGGIAPALEAVREAQASVPGLGFPACITYAAKMVAGQKAAAVNSTMTIDGNLAQQKARGFSAVKKLMEKEAVA